MPCRLRHYRRLRPTRASLYSPATPGVGFASSAGYATAGCASIFGYALRGLRFTGRLRQARATLSLAATPAAGCAVTVTTPHTGLAYLASICRAATVGHTLAGYASLSATHYAVCAIFIGFAPL